MKIEVKFLHVERKMKNEEENPKLVVPLKIPALSVMNSQILVLLCATALTSYPTLSGTT